MKNLCNEEMPSNGQTVLNWTKDNLYDSFVILQIKGYVRNYDVCL